MPVGLVTTTQAIRALPIAASRSLGLIVASVLAAFGYAVGNSLWHGTVP
jgi:hypothetical protein